MGIVLPLAAGALHGIILKYYYHAPDFADRFGLWLYLSLATTALLGIILRRQAMIIGVGIIGGQYLGTGIIIGLSPTW